MRLIVVGFGSSGGRKWRARGLFYEVGVRVSEMYEEVPTIFLRAVEYLVKHNISPHLFSLPRIPLR